MFTLSLQVTVIFINSASFLLKFKKAEVTNISKRAFLILYSYSYPHFATENSPPTPTPSDQEIQRNKKTKDKICPFLSLPPGFYTTARFKTWDMEVLQ